MMSRSSARDSYVAKRPLMTITYCRRPQCVLSRIRTILVVIRWLTSAAPLESYFPSERACYVERVSPQTTNISCATVRRKCVAGSQEQLLGCNAIRPAAIGGQGRLEELSNQEHFAEGEEPRARSITHHQHCIAASRVIDHQTSKVSTKATTKRLTSKG